MAETVKQIREWYAERMLTGEFGDKNAGRLCGNIGNLLAEIDRLHKWSAELSTANAGLALQAVEALTRLADAEKVCEAFDAARGGLMPSPQSAEDATRRYKELWLELLTVFGTYLAGKKQEIADGA